MSIWHGGPMGNLIWRGGVWASQMGAMPFLKRFPGAAAAYSLRDLNGTNPSVVRVRRSSDNAEKDFAAVDVSDGSLVTWVGAGNDGLVPVWYDQSGNSIDATQTVAADQPQIVYSGVIGGLDLDNGFLSVDTLTTTGTLVTATVDGTYALEVEVTSGQYDIFAYHIWDVEALIYYDRVIPDAEYQRLLAGLNLTGFTTAHDFGTDWIRAFRDRREIKSMPDFDFTGVKVLRETFQYTKAFRWLTDNFFDTASDVEKFENCLLANKLVSLPSGFLDAMTKVEKFRLSFRDNHLQTAPPNLFDTQTVCTDYDQCFSNNDLDATSVDNILVSIQYSADQNNLNNGIIGIDGGTNATPTQTGKDAADALRARGWTVNLNGY